MSLRDSFSYLPEGNFGGAYGSTGSQGIGALGNTLFSSFWGGSALGTVGLAARILNVSLADISENLTPKSSITVAGGYGFLHFYANDPATGLPYLNSSQVSAQAAYNRILTAHTQVALMYGYQAFDFSFAGTAFHTHLLQAMYGHRISGRMDLLIAAGPQLTLIDSQGPVCSISGIQIQFCILEGGTLIPTTTKDTRLGVAGQVRLRYKFPRTSVALSYERFETSGSGFFAGAQSDIARLSVERPLSRVWSAFADLGYSRSARLQDIVQRPSSEGPSNRRGFLGGGVHRAIGHDFHAFGSYQFNELSFDQSLCLTSTPCSRISNRHVITIGLDWTPRPIRID